MRNNVKPKRSPLAAWTQFGGELIVVTPENSVLHRFNQTATFIWEYLDGNHTFAEITVRLARSFNVTDEVAAGDLSQFLSKMLEDKLLAPEDGDRAWATQE